MDMKNKTINIFGSKYKIKYIDKVYDEEGNWIYGKVDTSNKEILISTLLHDDKPVQREEVEISLYHEIYHAILITGQYMQCSNDGPLVEWLARCTYSLIKQNVL